MRQKRPILRDFGGPLKTGAFSAQKRHGKKRAVFGYARVSTTEQDVRTQIVALRRAGCERVFADVGISGTSARRPELDALLSQVQSGDTIIVTALDRLGRSTSHLVTLVEDFAVRGIAFRSLRETLDTGSAAGKLILAIFAALATFERELLVERTREALAVKRRRGERLGRPRSLLPSQVHLAREMLERGELRRALRRTV